jgi:hypothetical protein
MLLLLLTTLFSHFQGLLSQAVDANGVSLADRVLAMEIQLLTPQTLLSIVTPCSLLFGADPNSGEQTSAEWVRIIFHNAITADIAAGTGSVQSFFSLSEIYSRNIVALMLLLALNRTDLRTLAFLFVNVTLSQFSQFFGAVTVRILDVISLNCEQFQGGPRRDLEFTFKPRGPTMPTVLPISK